MDATRVPAAGVRVRCPRCAHVFTLAQPPARPAPLPAPPPARPPGEPSPSGFERDLREPPRPRGTTPPGARGSAPTSPSTPRPLGGWHSQTERTLDLGTPAAKPAPQRLETPPFHPLPAAAPKAGTATTASPPPAAPSGQRVDPAHERARRLARVLISDIVVYNQAALDRARAEGSLATAFGPEISKAWELYKSKVGSEVAGGTSFFRDALNEILGEGEKIF